MSLHTIAKLQNFIADEEFDTDCIHIDIEDNIGNIDHEIESKIVMTLINQFITTNKSMTMKQYPL